MYFIIMAVYGCTFVFIQSSTFLPLFVRHNRCEVRLCVSGYLKYVISHSPLRERDRQTETQTDKRREKDRDMQI